MFFILLLFFYSDSKTNIHMLYWIYMGIGGGLAAYRTHFWEYADIDSKSKSVKGGTIHASEQAFFIPDSWYFGPNVYPHPLPLDPTEAGGSSRNFS
ncbi:hypothetical protein D3C81_1995800 [compost metagenome]